FVGHGIGTAMHEEPQIPNYGEPGRGPRLAEGMVLAIEPMINAGRPAVRILEDGWTAVTRDGSLSAHFEHTVCVTASGPVVLTTCNGAGGPSPERTAGESATLGPIDGPAAPGVTSVEAPRNVESRWRKRTRSK
ncbi:MAG: M24 family metallopeptidase, partial [Bacteroidales bacterium]